MKNRLLSFSLAASMAIGVLAPLPAMAYQHHHHRLAKIAGGLGAYELAKKTGRNRVAHGGKRNFAQRHPIMSGMAGAYGAGKIAKHHRHGG